MNKSLSPSLMEESLLFVGKLKKYIHCTSFCPLFEYKMLIDCKVSAINSTGPSNVQLIQVSVYTGPSLQKK